MSTEFDEAPEFENTGVDLQAASIPDDELADYMDSLSSQTDEGVELGDTIGGDEGMEQDSDTENTDDADGEFGEEDDSEELEADSDEGDDGEADSDEDTEKDVDGLQRVLSPFKANGKMIQVDNVDDAISLMQMGANYSEKMHSLKPHLKTIRMLEKQEALEEGVLHTLLDAKNGNLEAIRKLIADAKIDPTDLLDIDPDTPVDYSPKDYAISDIQYEFENVVEDLKHSPHYSTTMDTVSQWDERSKAKMYEDPSILRGLHAVIANEHFEKIQTHLGTLRTLGKVPAGMTDVDAFGMAAQMLEERGELGMYPPPANQQQERNQPKRNDEIVERKRAVAPAKGRKAAPKATGLNLDLAKMTDEEFTKAYDAGLFKQITQ